MKEKRQGAAEAAFRLRFGKLTRRRKNWFVKQAIAQRLVDAQHLIDDVLTLRALADIVPRLR